MAWIDYKIAYDMVVQSWISHCLKMYEILDEVIQFKTMETWRVELTARGKTLAEVKIQRYIPGRCNITACKNSHSQKMYSRIQTQ